MGGGGGGEWNCRFTKEGEGGGKINPTKKANAYKNKKVWKTSLREKQVISVEKFNQVDSLRAYSVWKKRTLVGGRMREDVPIHMGGKSLKKVGQKKDMTNAQKELPKENSLGRRLQGMIKRSCGTTVW